MLIIYDIKVLDIFYNYEFWQSDNVAFVIKQKTIDNLVIGEVSKVSSSST